MLLNEISLAKAYVDQVDQNGDKEGGVRRKISHLDICIERFLRILILFSYCIYLLNHMHVVSNIFYFVG